MADLAVAVPSLSQVESASFGYLLSAAAYWRSVSHTLLVGFTEVRDATLAPGGHIWRGQAAQGAQRRAASDVTTIGAPCEQLLTAAGIAERAHQQLEAHRQGVLEAVNDAIRDGFVVNDDYSVTDTRDYYSEEEFEQRDAAARGHASFIGHRVMNLVAADRETATNLDAATDGLDALDFGTEADDTVHLAGWDRPLSPAPKDPTDQSAFDDLLRANDQAVLDAMARVKAAQKALDDAASKAYAHGAGSDEAQDAMTRLPALKKNLADALDELGKIPDYSSIDPASVQLGPDGALSFAYTLEGQKMVVTGALKNGSGEIYDQGAGSGSSAYFTYQDGKLVASRFLDPGRVTPDDALLQNVIFTAVGAGPAVTAGKAGVEASWQGMRTLFAREALEAGGGSTTGLTADNVLPRAIAQAEIRAQAAADDLALHHPHTPVTAGGDHTPPTITHDHPLPDGGAHLPHPIPPEPVAPGPAFTLDNPLDHMTPELRVLSEQHLTGSGETVLGPFAPRGGGPSYIDFAEQRGASYFDIGTTAWDSATDTERLAANQHVLDVAISNRDIITLSVPIGKIGPNTFTGAELRYLEAHGYQRVGTNTLAPPPGGSP